MLLHGIVICRHRPLHTATDNKIQTLKYSINQILHTAQENCPCLWLVTVSRMHWLRTEQSVLSHRTNSLHKQYSLKPTTQSKQSTKFYNLTQSCSSMMGTKTRLGIEWAQALADISRLVLCCHSNETCASIASPPNSAQLEGTLYHSPNLHPGLCSSVGMWQGTDGQDTQTAMTTRHFASATPHVKWDVQSYTKYL